MPLNDLLNKVGKQGVQVIACASALALMVIEKLMDISVASILTQFKPKKFTLLGDIKSQMSPSYYC